MDLTALVVAYRSGSLAGRCLESLRAAAGGLAFEAVVVENGGPSEAPSWARRIPAAGNPGFARAVNLGLSAARGRHVLLANPDVLLRRGSIAEAVGFLDGRPEATAAGFRLVDARGRLQPSCRRFPRWTALFSARESALARWLPGNPLSRDYLMADFARDEPRRVDWVSGAFLLARRADLLAEGGLDPRFFLYCEDVDLCKRLWASGREVWFLPCLEAVHSGGASARQRPLATLRAHHRSMWAYYRKHHARGAIPDAAAASAVALRALAGAVRLGVA